jgi:dephospho-CoA kinase
MSTAPLFAVGLTGGIGSGKSTVADLFAARGAAVIDTDQIAHQLTAAGGAAMPAIRDTFGADFLTADGAMDRVKMRQRVFTDGNAKRELEAILHPLIQSECERAAIETAGHYLLFVVPLLVESGRWRQRVTRVLVVDCAETTQVQRVMRRSGMTQAEVHAIMAAQVPRATRLAAADDIIVNDADATALTPQVDRLHALYMALSKVN